MIQILGLYNYSCIFLIVARIWALLVYQGLFPPILVKATQVDLRGKLQVRRQISCRIHFLPCNAMALVGESIPVAKTVFVFPIFLTWLFPDHREVNGTTRPVCVDERTRPSTISPGSAALCKHCGFEEGLRKIDEVVSCRCQRLYCFDTLRRDFA